MAYEVNGWIVLGLSLATLGLAAVLFALAFYWFARGACWLAQADSERERSKLERMSVEANIAHRAIASSRGERRD